jgi:hypothetical protein
VRNFQLLGAQNVTPLLHQIALHPELWNQHTVRTAHSGSPHKQVDDMLLRFQSEGSQVVDDPECVWYPAWDVLTEAHDLIFNLARMVKAERVGRVIISRMAPGKVIDPHEDGGAVADYYTRYQMPLQSEAGVVFDCAGERVQMAGGQVWWFNNKLTHSVVNNSATDRIAMVVDLKTR